MRLTTIGTGTAAPSRGRVQSGYLVDAGDVQLLMDCGSGITTRMADLGLPWQRITHLAITHFHADHVVDVPLFDGQLRLFLRHLSMLLQWQSRRMSRCATIKIGDA